MCQTFLFKAEYYSTMCMYNILFTHYLTMDTLIASLFWLLLIMLLWTWVCRYIFEDLFLVFWGINSEMESGSYNNSYILLRLYLFHVCECVCVFVHTCVFVCLLVTRSDSYNGNKQYKNRINGLNPSLHYSSGTIDLPVQRRSISVSISISASLYIYLSFRLTRLSSHFSVV